MYVTTVVFALDVWYERITKLLMAPRTYCVNKVFVKIIELKWSLTYLDPINTQTYSQGPKVFQLLPKSVGNTSGPWL